MPITRNIELFKEYPYAKIQTNLDYVSGDNSLRNSKGGLVLRSNAMILDRFSETYRKSFQDPFTKEWTYLPDATAWPRYIGASRAAADEIAWSKFRNRIHVGDASLGVTLGSFGQTMSMLTGRLNTIANILKAVKGHHDYATMRKVINKQSQRKAIDPAVGKKIAGTHLEVVFGWLPLLSDARAMMGVLTGDLPPSFISTRGKSTDSYNFKVVEGAITTYQSHNIRSSVAVSAIVTVTNHNLWLLNRLGLVNPAVVAWDLVPWSFVVNMFVNVNEVVRSYTDYVGLQLSNVSTTYNSSGVVDLRRDVKYEQTARNGTAISGYYFKKKQRVLGGTPPRPSFRLKLPNVNLGLAAIASSLVVQQSKRIQSIVGINK